MIGRDISIANKLEVLAGNVLLVPGCEPTSAFTSVTLDANRKCKSSVISVEEALEVIPGATLEFLRNPTKMFFVLPFGPPPTPGCNTCLSVTDYYQLLRDNGDPTCLPKTIEEINIYDKGSKSDCQPDPFAGCASVDQLCRTFPLKGILG
jgi:hypothetical protein